MTSYVVVVSSGYASIIHGLWREESARATADRWNRAFARKGLKLTATAQPVAGKSARVRDFHAAWLSSAAEDSAAEEMAHAGCEGCPDCDPDDPADGVSATYAGGAS